MLTPPAGWNDIRNAITPTMIAKYFALIGKMIRKTVTSGNSIAKATIRP